MDDALSKKLDETHKYIKSQMSKCPPIYGIILSKKNNEDEALAARVIKLMSALEKYTIAVNNSRQALVSFSYMLKERFRQKCGVCDGTNAQCISCKRYLLKG